MVFVSVSYPGASPEAAEAELTRPIELALNGIAGVKMIRSNSLEGRSETVVEFELSADMTRAVQDVRDKVSALQPGFPRDAKPPFISRFDGDNAQPTVYLSLLAPERSARELSLLADQTVRKRLERVGGVARVQVTGLTVRQVRIDLDPQRLRAYQLTPADIASALQRANTDVPVGLLSNAREDAILRVEGKVRDAKAFGDIVVAQRGALVLRLSDLGELVEREREPILVAGRRRAGDLLPGLQAAGRQHRRHRRGHQGARPKSCARRCRRASNCAWSTPTATG